jgi:hypothetical protein
MGRENAGPEGTIRNRGQKGVLWAKTKSPQYVNRGVNR